MGNVAAARLRGAPMPRAEKPSCSLQVWDEAMRQASLWGPRPISSGPWTCWGEAVAPLGFQESREEHCPVYTCQVSELENLDLAGDALPSWEIHFCGSCLMSNEATEEGLPSFSFQMVIIRAVRSSYSLD